MKLYWSKNTFPNRPRKTVIASQGEAQSTKMKSTMGRSPTSLKGMIKRVYSIRVTSKKTLTNTIIRYKISRKLLLEIDLAYNWVDILYRTRWATTLCPTKNERRAKNRLSRGRRNWIVQNPKIRSQGCNSCQDQGRSRNRRILRARSSISALMSCSLFSQGTTVKSMKKCSNNIWKSTWKQQRTQS